MDGSFKLIGTSSVSLHSQSLLHSPKSHRLKAREARVKHQLHKVHEVSVVFSHGKITLNRLLDKELVRLCLLAATKDLDVLLCHLEVG